MICLLRRWGGNKRFDAHTKYARHGVAAADDRGRADEDHTVVIRCDRLARGAVQGDRVAAAGLMFSTSVDLIVTLLAAGFFGITIVNAG